MTCGGRKDLGDGPGPGVEVIEDGSAGTSLPKAFAHIAADQVIEDLRAAGIGLEEGRCRDLEPKSQQFLIEPVPAKKRDHLLTLEIVGKAVLIGVKETDEAPLKRQRLQTLCQWREIMFLLVRRHKDRKDLVRGDTVPQKEIAEIARVIHLIVFRKMHFPAVGEHFREDLRHILRHDAAGVGSQDVVGRPLLMEAQSQRSAGTVVPEGKLHFIAVTGLFRASKDAVPDRILLHDRGEELPELLLLETQLFLIRQRLVGTAAAGGKDPAQRFPRLQRGRFQDLQQPSFHLVRVLLRDPVTDLLPRNRIFHDDLLPGLRDIGAAVRIFHLFDRSLCKILALEHS